MPLGAMYVGFRFSGILGKFPFINISFNCISNYLNILLTVFPENIENLVFSRKQTLQWGMLYIFRGLNFDIGLKFWLCIVGGVTSIVCLIESSSWFCNQLFLTLTYIWDAYCVMYLFFFKCGHMVWSFYMTPNFCNSFI